MASWAEIHYIDLIFIWDSKKLYKHINKYIYYKNLFLLLLLCDTHALVTSKLLATSKLLLIDFFNSYH